MLKFCFLYVCSSESLYHTHRNTTSSATPHDINTNVTIAPNNPNTFAGYVINTCNVLKINTQNVIKIRPITIVPVTPPVPKIFQIVPIILITYFLASYAFCTLKSFTVTLFNFPKIIFCSSFKTKDVINLSI